MILEHQVYNYTRILFSNWTTVVYLNVTFHYLQYFISIGWITFAHDYAIQYNSTSAISILVIFLLVMNVIRWPSPSSGCTNTALIANYHFKSKLIIIKHNWPTEVKLHEMVSICGIKMVFELVGSVYIWGWLSASFKFCWCWFFFCC